VCPGDLASQHGIIIGDVCRGIVRTVLEFQLKAALELIRINLGPVDAKRGPDLLRFNGTDSSPLHGQLLFIQKR
jgi:hypothetical protein